jgi:putative colanic acid biosynthesis UDP-glucose lipid carrier transferase
VVHFMSSQCLAVAAQPVRHPISGWGASLKFLEDYLIGALVLLAFLPLMLLIALAVKLDSKGPVIFRQTRHGLNRQEITVFKFRTMIDTASGDVTQARRNDPRVTRTGKVLRRFSLDELPQLFNVLRGEMALVGPRPHAVQHTGYFEALVERYDSRHRVKPGITGWAQVNGLRGSTPTWEQIRRRIEHDLYYIDHWSIWFDLRILAMTPFKGFFHENAF